MRHIRPDKWADAARGRLAEAQVARMEVHARECEQCAKERERVERSLDVFADIRAVEPEDMHWEHIGARIYWVMSSERRTGRIASSWRQRRWMAPLAVSLAAAALVLLGVGGLSGWFAGDGAGERAAAVPQVPDGNGSAVAPSQPDNQRDTGDRIATAKPDEPAGLPLAGMVTFLEGEVVHNGAPLTFDAVIAPGDRLQTRTGRVAVQFGADESFTLHRDSDVSLTAFDERRVLLSLTGDIAIDIGHRLDDQTFAVRAGERQVEVRGTRFSVSQRTDGLRVACSEGEVAVLGGGARELSVPAGRVALWPGKGLGNAPSLRAMAPAEVEDLGRWLFRVPAWTSAPELRGTTSQLQIAASAKDEIEIDGQLIASGPFALRVMPGRHHVRTGRESGSWVELGAGAAVAASAKPAAPKPPAATAESPARRRARARSVRRKQLNRALAGGSRLNGCVRALRKQNLLANGFIELELGVSADGTIGYLNIVDSNLSSKTASCIRDAVDRITFGKGPATSLQHRIEW